MDEQMFRVDCVDGYWGFWTQAFRLEEFNAKKCHWYSARVYDSSGPYEVIVSDLNLRMISDVIKDLEKRDWFFRMVTVTEGFDHNANIFWVGHAGCVPCNKISMQLRAAGLHKNVVVVMYKTVASGSLVIITAMKNDCKYSPVLSCDLRRA